MYRMSCTNDSHCSHCSPCSRRRSDRLLLHCSCNDCTGRSDYSRRSCQCRARKGRDRCNKDNGSRCGRVCSAHPRAFPFDSCHCRNYNLPFDRTPFLGVRCILFRRPRQGSEKTLRRSVCGLLKIFVGCACITGAATKRQICNLLVSSRTEVLPPRFSGRNPDYMYYFPAAHALGKYKYDVHAAALDSSGCSAIASLTFCTPQISLRSVRC